MIPARSEEKNNNGDDAIWETPASFYEFSQPNYSMVGPKAGFRDELDSFFVTPPNMTMIHISAGMKWIW